MEPAVLCPADGGMHASMTNQASGALEGIESKGIGTASEWNSPTACSSPCNLD